MHGHHTAEAKEFIKDFDAGSIVLVTCGPMARVLVKEWYEKRPDLTIIDIGSTFRPVYQKRMAQLPQRMGRNWFQFNR